MLLIVTCRTQAPLIKESEQIDSLEYSGPEIIFNDDLYNKRWFENQFFLFERDFESSMISPNLVPVLTLEKNKILDILNNMSLKEKIGQLFILDLKNREMDFYYTEMNADLKNYIEDFKPGGVIFFSDNIYSNKQVKKFIADLQSILTLPLFVAVDQEGGRISRLNSSSEMDVLEIPSHGVLGTLNDREITWEIGKIIGEELNNLGFNMNLAPVADINSNYMNPVLGDRSFSERTEIVSSMVRPFVQGLQESGVCSVIKHFPGHGDTSTDPHSGEVSIYLSLPELRSRELIPFVAGITQGAVGVMTAHIKTPGIDATNDLPATLSPFFINNILRDELGFDGLVISDSFSMAAIKDYWFPEESSVAFLTSGGDIILRPSDIKAARDGLLKSLSNGILTEDRINKSVFRILAAKYRFGFFTDYQPTQRFNLEEGQLFLAEIMRKYKNQNLK